MKVYFKKTFWGSMVMMVQDRKPGELPGNWNKSWRKATELESQEFLSDIESCKEHYEIIKKLKDSHPHLFL